MHRHLRFLIVAALAVGALRCSSLVSWFSEEDAPWTYVVTAWGGLRVGEPAVAGDRVRLPLDLQFEKATRMDSAVCVGPLVKTAVQGRTIAITLRRRSCEGGSGSAILTLAAEIPRPPPGEYDVVYQGPDQRVSLRRAVIP